MTVPAGSFVVVTHRRSRWLPAALESIHRQTIVNYEIVVVVNGPDPETERILRDLGSEVRVTVLTENQGVGGGRNAGILLSHGEFLVFLDDDAEFRDSDAVSRAVRYFEQVDDLGVVGLKVLDARTGLVERRSLPFRSKRLPTSVTSATYYAGGACVVRRRVFEQVGLYDDSLFYAGEELDLSYRLLEAGFRILFDPSVAVIHHGVSGSGESEASYYYARNRPWVAMRHLPLGSCVTHCLAWWTWSLARGFRDRTIAAAIRGVRDCVAAMPAQWRQRRPVSRRTRLLLLSNNGRLWY